MEQPAAAGQQRLSPCDVAALQRCLKENRGDRHKCEKEVLAFQQACSAAPAAQQQQPAAGSKR
ncbi:hypothetical protein HT031_005645 [Scenedesmus sp. PABB004]|nr:hypothetical protein HT031_005645 [Scenedesmus sp. PABB004]